MVIINGGIKMLILLSSENPSKKRSLELALKELKITDYEIKTFKMESGVHNQPIGYEITRGALNRNVGLKKIAQEQDLKYDYLVSIEGGFSTDENGLPFVGTYCVIENAFGHKSTGKSLGLRLSKDMWEYLREGKDLNKLISDITKQEKYNENGGITGYLTEGLFSREKIDRDAIISSFISFIFTKERDRLNHEIEKRIKNDIDND